MLLSKFCSLFFGLHEMSNDNEEQYSEDENVLNEEEVMLISAYRLLNTLYYYTENDKQYDLQPSMYHIDDKYLYISRNLENRYYRYSLVSARRNKKRIPLRMKDGNIVLARADLLTADNQYLTRTKEVTQYLNRISQQQNHVKQHSSFCKSATMTTALTVLSTILIAIILRH